ncbi:MAG: AAA family ATPase [Saprospiraceae bacterium]|nr:AAA family ATPase [Saprospiraceae bacterium]MDW8482685.1 AAA family ATPase [Saprospiraceae bacterium]
MLNKLTIRNFKLFEEVEIELAERVVFIGPNNSGKTSALQALALWDVGVKRWLEKRRSGRIPKERSGVTINRRDLVAIPTPSANLLWRHLRTRSGERQNERLITQNVRIEIGVEGADKDVWECYLEFDYANEESIYCRPPLLSNGTERWRVPEHLRHLRVAYLPPMSGLSAREPRVDAGYIRVQLGEGRTAEVLRNLCWQVLDGPDGKEKWREITEQIARLFGSRLDEPRYIAERGEIAMSYRTREGVQLDISSCGRGEQQTLLLLAYLAAHPGSVLLLDEPDAHLELLRQRQIYQLLSEETERHGSQLIAASHSEVVLNEASDRDVVVAFVGKPHRMNNRTQILKALRDVGLEDYYQAEQTGWILYLEGATDLAILKAFAQQLQHAKAIEALDRPFVRYVGNQPAKAREHFYALREAKIDLIGVAIFDRIDKQLEPGQHLREIIWRRRELENYLCQKNTLLAFVEYEGRKIEGSLFATIWQNTMEDSIKEVEKALRTLGKDPWSDDIKASEEFLEPLFKVFYQKLQRPNDMAKKNFYALAQHVQPEDISPEILQALEIIAQTASKAQKGA